MEKLLKEVHQCLWSEAFLKNRSDDTAIVNNFKNELQQLQRCTQIRKISTVQKRLHQYSQGELESHDLTRLHNVLIYAFQDKPKTPIPSLLKNLNASQLIAIGLLYTQGEIQDMAEKSVRLITHEAEYILNVLRELIIGSRLVWETCHELPIHTDDYIKFLKYVDSFYTNGTKDIESGSTSKRKRGPEENNDKTTYRQDDVKTRVLPPANIVEQGFLGSSPAAFEHEVGALEHPPDRLIEPISTSTRDGSISDLDKIGSYQHAFFQDLRPDTNNYPHLPNRRPGPQDATILHNIDIEPKSADQATQDDLRKEWNSLNLDPQTWDALPTYIFTWAKIPVLDKLLKDCVSLRKGMRLAPLWAQETKTTCIRTAEWKAKSFLSVVDLGLGPNEISELEIAKVKELFHADKVELKTVTQMHISTSYSDWSSRLMMEIF